MSSPDVSLSKRWTMPGRLLSSPTSLISGYCFRRISTKVSFSPPASLCEALRARRRGDGQRGAGAPSAGRGRRFLDDRGHHRTGSSWRAGCRSGVYAGPIKQHACKLRRTRDMPRAVVDGEGSRIATLAVCP